MGCHDRKKVIPRPSEFVLERLTLEVQPVNDLTFKDVEIQRFKEEYQAHGICAVESIQVLVRPSLQINKNTWSSSDLNALKSQYQTMYDRNFFDREMTIFVAHVPGHYDEANDTIGLSFGPDFIVYFDYSQAAYQSSTIIHEVGHSLGLVDRSRREGPPANPDAPNHCNTNTCVMFWQVAPFATFDDLCDKDLGVMKIFGPSAATRCNCKKATQ